LAIYVALGLSAATAADARRPNFLFVLADDQAPQTLAAYGNAICQTPHLDRLAREGMRIDDAHHMGSWSGAVCLPSRTMIMTGRTVWRLPNAPGRRAELDPLETPEAVAARASLPTLLNAAGYDTFRTCKWGNTFQPANELFDERHDADRRGATAEDGSPWHAEHALDFLRRRQAAGDQDPFFLFLGFSHPHDPRNGAPELLQKYGAANVEQPPTTVGDHAPPLPINYLPAHPFAHGHPGLRDETQVQGVLTDRSPTTIRNELGREYACIELIDQQIGRVLAQLETMGELDDTYVIFTADHGIAVGRHGLVGKQNLYEHTWRVPLLVRGPGVAPGSSASGFAYLLDILPTVCDLAGVVVPAEIEGVSLHPVLIGESPRVRDVLYGVYCGGTKPGMRSVKTADGWKLVKFDVLGGKVRETQLFNLRENPHELLVEHHAAEVVALTGNRPLPQQVDLADDPQYAAQRNQLETLLLDLQGQLDDPYRLWDQPAVEAP
jgi:arylsulfatase A-like enzyme